MGIEGTEHLTPAITHEVHTAQAQVCSTDADALDADNPRLCSMGKLIQAIGTPITTIGTPILLSEAPRHENTLSESDTVSKPPLLPATGHVPSSELVLNGRAEGSTGGTRNRTPSPPSSLLSPWLALKPAPADPILCSQTLLRADRSGLAVDLSVGAYRGADGRATELRCVAAAHARIARAPRSHGYLPLAGDGAFRALAAELVFGASVPSDCIASVQTVSGSGALRLALEFCRARLGASVALLPDPTWPNHAALALAAGLRATHYPYYDARARSLRAGAMAGALRRAPRGAVVVLHACGHNPSGADLRRAEWDAVADAVAARGLVPLFDAAYLGLAGGDVARDAGAVRAFAKRGVPVLVALSFSKSLGLYNARVGALLAAVPGAPDAAAAATSQIVAGARAMYSSPPAHGARVAREVLADPALREMWAAELGEMTLRMRKMRERLADELGKRGGDGWAFVAQGSGMFALLGLSPQQVADLGERWHVYLAPAGRLNVSGLTDANVARVAQVIVAVTTGDQGGGGDGGRD